MMQRLKSLLIIFILFLIIAIIITFPLILHLNDRVIGMIKHPGLQGELFQERNILYNMKKGNFIHWFITDLVNYPKGQDLGLKISHSLHLFFSLPLSVLFGPISAYNILVIITFALNGFMMYLLAKDFFPSKSVAFSSGLFFMFNPYILLKINMGFLQKITLFWLPLYFLCLFRLLKKRKNIYIFGSSLFLLLVSLTYPPYAAYAILFTIILLVYNLVKTKGSLHFLKNVFSVIILFLAAEFLIIYIFDIRIFSSLYEFSYKDPPFFIPHGYIDIFHPFKFYLPYPTNLPMGLSLVVTGLGIFAAFLNRGFPRFLLITAVVFMIIAAGPYLMINEKPMIVFNHKIILPYYLFYKYTPYVYGKDLVLPIRTFPILNICFALLIGYALSRLAKKIPKKCFIIVIFLFLFIYFFENLIRFPELFPISMSRLDIPKFYRKIKDEDFEAILNLPVYLPRSYERNISSIYCYYATIANKKIMNSYDGKEFSISFPEGSDSIELKRQFVYQLSKWGVRYILVHKELLEEIRCNMFNGTNDFEWLAYFCGFPTDYENDKLIVYRIPENK